MSKGSPPVGCLGLLYVAFSSRLRKKSMCSKRYEGFHRAMRYVNSMRGDDEQQGAVFSYINPEERIPSDHPLRAIRAMVDRALKELGVHFEALYARRGRPSIPPE